MSEQVENVLINAVGERISMSHAQMRIDRNVP